MTGLEGRGSALELRPPKQITSEIISTQTKNLMASLPRYPNPAPSQWGEQDSNLRRRCHQIYSLAPLAAREPPRIKKFSRKPNSASRRITGQRTYRQPRSSFKLAVGFEPTTSGLQNRCSAVELRQPGTSVKPVILQLTGYVAR